MFSPGKERFDRTGVGGTSVKKLVLALSLCVLAGVVARPAHSAPAPLAAPNATIRTLVLGFSGGMDAVNDAYTSGDIVGSVTRTADVAAFNAQTPTQLRGLYDVIWVTWNAGNGFNLDWTTRLLPYLRMGGGVCFEDPLNLGDLAPVVNASQDNASGPWTLTAVPGLTDGLLLNGFGFNNDHIRFNSWDPSIFAPFITSPSAFGGTKTSGIYGQIPGGGRIVITGPDQDYHSMMPSNQYMFLLNELNWVTSAATYADLKGMIPPLVGPGKLTQRYADVLLQLVNRAEAYTTAGAFSQAISMLRSFQSYVTRYQSSGWLTGAEATALLDESNGIIAQLLP